MGRYGRDPRAPASTPAGSGRTGAPKKRPGTAVHIALLGRFSESTKAGFFGNCAVRYVDATDLVSLELMGSHPVALTNTIDALARRWADTAEVDVEFLAPPESLQASGAEVRQALGRRLRALQGKDLDIQSRN